MEHANAGELFDYIVRNDRVDDINAGEARHVPQNPNAKNPMDRGNYRWKDKPE